MTLHWTILEETCLSIAYPLATLGSSLLFQWCPAIQLPFVSPHTRGLPHATFTSSNPRCCCPRKILNRTVLQIPVAVARAKCREHVLVCSSSNTVKAINGITRSSFDWKWDHIIAHEICSYVAPHDPSFHLQENLQHFKRGEEHDAPLLIPPVGGYSSFLSSHDSGMNWKINYKSLRQTLLLLRSQVQNNS